MSELAAHSYVRQALAAERAAPVKTTGFFGVVRTRLFNSPTNIVLTIGGALLIWFTVVPSLKFLLVALALCVLVAALVVWVFRFRALAAPAPAIAPPPS